MKTMHKQKTRAMALMLILALLLFNAVPAVAETFSAIVTAASMTVYSDAKLTQRLASLEKDTVVRVTSYSGKAARISYSGRTGYARVADLKAVDDVAAKAVTNADARVYQTPSTKARSAKLLKGTRLYVLTWTDEWAEVEKDGTTGYMQLKYLTLADDNWNTVTPTAEPAGQRGVVTAKTTRVYKKASSSSKKLGTLKRGQEINVIRWDSKWAYIELNGNYGYCAVKDIAQAAATPTPTPVPTPTPAPAADAPQGKVTSSSLKVYKSASTSAQRVMTLKKGEVVSVLKWNSKWAYVEYGGLYGFCKVTGLTPVSATATPKPTATPEASVKATVVDENVVVYKQASTSASVLGSLMWGDTVNVLSVTGNWAYIEKDGNKGYCRVTALLTNKPDADETLDGYKPADFDATVVRTGAYGYTRPSADAAATALPLGANVYVTGYSKDLEWASVVMNDERLFVQIKYLSKAAYSTVAATGTEMNTLLKALLSYGYFDGIPSATPDNSAASTAIRRFQAACGMTQTGTADTALQRVLYGGYAPASPILSASLSSGAKGDSVSRIQMRLYALGYLSKAASLDGDYGTTTATAVGLFQKANGITATGAADTATLKALYSAGAVMKSSSVKAADAASSSSGSGSGSDGSVVSPSGTVTLSSTYVTTMPAALKSTTTSYSSSMSNAKKLEYVIYVAQSNLGKPYVYGATGTSSFDCSGLTQYSFKKADVSLKRTAYSQGYDSSYTKIESISSLKRGDLIFFNTISDSDLCDHVGIYLGGQCFIHASSGGHKVVVSSVASGYYKRVFSWGRRVLK